MPNLPFSLSWWSGRIRTPDLTIMSRMFNHCATRGITWYFMNIESRIGYAFHLCNSLVVTRNWRLILLIKLLVFKVSEGCFKNSKNYKVVLSFFSSFSYHQFCDFSLSKNCLKYSGLLLPPGGKTGSYGNKTVWQI